MLLHIYAQDGLSISEKEAKMTDPVEAEVFVRETQIDLLAVTIGNVHGSYSRPPALDFARLEAIAARVPSSLPLVLHGASGLPGTLIQGAIQRGVCKFNVNTDLRAAAMRALRQAINNNPKVREEGK
jgi:tagatose 1,6-diphosphate aldolase GatY/KbaY